MLRSNPYKYYSVSPLPRAEHKFAEILVLGQQQAVFLTCPLQHLRIDSSSTQFSDVQHVVFGRTQAAHEAGVDAFIREPAHIAGSVVNDFLVGEIVSCERLRRANIL